jgi:hypothetical protein
MTGWKNDRDHPLSCHWRPVAPDAYDALGLPPARSKVAAIMRAQIITEAFVVGRADKDSWISYSRREAFYTARRGRYWPKTFTYSTVVSAVDQLAASGLIDHQKMPPGHRGEQSRFKASGTLNKILNETPVTIIHEPREEIVLRDNDGNPIDYIETERSSRLRHNAREINEVIVSAAIGIQGGTICEGDPVEVGGVRIGAASNQLRRVFHRGSFSNGGRFYGTWWQNIPSEFRAGITINGRQTVEMDYPYLHPILMYAEAGKSMRGDPYDLPKWPRDLVKKAFNTLVNADTLLAAIRSIANEIGGAGAFCKAQALVCEIEAKHVAIACMFGSGAGLRLMRRDSDMTERLLLRLAKRGVVALPIHDSYIVPNRIRDKGELMEGMAEAMHRSVGNRFSLSGTYSKSLPQYGARGGGGGGSDLLFPEGASPEVVVGCIAVFFPESQQGDFFVSTSLAVPAADILGWTSGLAPVGVQKALRHEMRRRRLRHADVARRIGISRPQFEGIFQGRFGASRAVASRLRNFLIEGAKTVGISS